MQLRGATASHVGNVREANQDRVHFGGFVAVVADGMGGHQGGEMAASIAISEFVHVVDPIGPGGLVELVEDANRAVFERAADPDLRGMGTTLVALTLRPEEEKVSVVNVGDSRAYYVRNGEMGQVTVDHSLVEDLVRQNRLTPDEALTHPQRNILTRALGIASEVEVDTFLLPTMIGDRFLLCSDGLFNEVSEEDILSILTVNADAGAAAEALVLAALEGAARDNVTVAVVDVVENGGGGDVSRADFAPLQMPSYEADTVEADITGNGDHVGNGGHSGNGGPMAVDAVPPPSADPTAEAPIPAEVHIGRLVNAEADQAAVVSASPAVARSAVGLAEPVAQPIPEVAEREPTTAPETTTPPDPERRRRLAPALFGVGLGALCTVGAYYAAGIWARQTWYLETVSATDARLAAVNGRPDGFWFLSGEPEPPTDVELVELEPAAQLEISNGLTFDTEAEALDFIADNTVVGTGLGDAVGTADPAESETEPDTGQGESSTSTPPAEGGDDAGGNGLDTETLDDLTEGVPEDVITTTLPDG